MIKFIRRGGKLVNANLEKPEEDKGDYLFPDGSRAKSLFPDGVEYASKSVADLFVKAICCARRFPVGCVRPWGGITSELEALLEKMHEATYARRVSGDVFRGDEQLTDYVEVLRDYAKGWRKDFHGPLRRFLDGN